jgi:hypothetical protein
MHHRLLVTLALAPGASSLEARMMARSKLVEDDSFCGPGGRFGAPLCDWFVLGGRWSGCLHKDLLGPPYQEALHQEFPDLNPAWLPDRVLDQNRNRLNHLWRRFGGRDSHPWTRTGYEELGYDDDARLIDQPLYDHFLRTHRGLDFDGEPNFADLDGDAVDDWFIGRKWLVVFDYHN